MHSRALSHGCDPLRAIQSFFLAGGHGDTVVKESCCPTLGWMKRVAQTTDELVAGLERGNVDGGVAPLEKALQRATRTFIHFGIEFGRQSTM